MALTLLKIGTHSPRQMVDITARLREVLQEAAVESGTLTVFCPHTTAGITINENADPDVVRDMIDILEGLIPEQGPYRHLEGNSHAHVKASLVGASETILVEHGRLMLGTWQGIYLCEFDGPRHREVWVRIQRD